jgi:hypothetical protein
MKRIIICEGKTDAILLSYFLIKKYGWQYEKKEDTRLKSDIGFQIDKDNEELNWYVHTGKPNQELAIWGVGGIDNIPKRLGDVIDRTRRAGNRIERRPTEKRFEKVILFFDRDIQTDDGCLNLVNGWLKENQVNFDEIEFEQWMEFDITLFNGEQNIIKVMAIVLPRDAQGNLETFLAESLGNQEDHDRHLVDEACSFIDKIPNEPYLTKKRLRSKACLGSILSVISPDWVFSELDRRLKLVEWEKLESVSSVYSLLGEL